MSEAAGCPRQRAAAEAKRAEREASERSRGSSTAPAAHGTIRARYDPRTTAARAPWPRWSATPG